MLCRHFQDLARACYRRDIFTFSDFLSLHEQSLFLESVAPELNYINWRMEGGYDYAERKILVFEPAEAGYDAPASLCAVSIRPVNARFAEDLTHRDYLGAMLHLGLERALLGDILPMEDVCYVFCKEAAADLILRELTRIRHTSVRCSLEEVSEIHYQPKLEEIRGTVASIRLDSAISLAFSGSRSRLSGLIEGEKVFVNGKLITSNGYRLKEGDVISVRGYGKFLYEREVSQTKKGRTMIVLQKFV